MKIKFIKMCFLLSGVFYYTLSNGESVATNPLRIIEYNKIYLKPLINVDNTKIAFIDLSELREKPKITITNLNGDMISSFPIPTDRYSKSWVHWGPGISYNEKKGTPLYLAPKLGLTEFKESGEIVTTINHPAASHQIQLTKDDTIVMPYSWDGEDDAQLSEIDRNGNEIFKWNAKKFLLEKNYGDSPARSQPASFTATTSAKKTISGNFCLSLAQKDLIIKIDPNGKVLSEQTVKIRPHTLVVHGEKLIGYSARLPNRLHLFSKSCDCYKEVILGKH